MFSGCVSAKPQPQPVTRNLSQHLPTDIVIPVDFTSDLISSNVMTKKKGVPGGPLIYEGLVTKDRNGRWIPALAESWNVSDDAKTWTFHLVHNATWQDGVPLTSADVKFTNDYLKANNLTMGYVLSDVDSVSCPDNYTVVFTLKNSYSVWPDRLAQSPGIGVYPKHIFENISNPQTYRDERFIGSGPFKYDTSEEGYFRVARNENYRGPVPKISGVILKLITNKDSQVLALKNGEIDVVSGLSPAVADSLRQDPNIGIFTLKDTTGYEMAFDVVNYPTNITLFRRALSHTVDRDTICSVLGNAHPTNTTFLLPGVAGDYVDPSEIGMYDYNLSKARELLAEAGFVQDNQGTLRGPDGNPVVLIVPLGGKAAAGGVNEKILTVLRNDWAKLGIKTDSALYSDDGQYLKAIAKGNVFIDGMPAILHDDPDDLVNFAHSPLQENYYHFNNSGFNTLTAEVRNTVNRTERKEIGYQMQEILAENIPTVPICSTDSLIAYRKDRFTGWENLSLLEDPNVIDPRILSGLTPVSSS
jgi:peptide/nickel transport system substrate-binding protein